MNSVTFFKNILRPPAVLLSCFLAFSCLLITSFFPFPGTRLTALASPVSEDTGSGESLPSGDDIYGDLPGMDDPVDYGFDEGDPSDGNDGDLEEDPVEEWPATWPEDGIAARIPVPAIDMESLEVNICMENDFMGTLNATEEDYETYLLSCREYGFTSEEETLSSYEGDFYSAGFSAFDIDGYKITVEYYCFQDPETGFPGSLSIRIRAPIRLGTLQWPDYALGLLIPHPPTTVGGAGGDPEIFLRASLGDMPVEAWRDYARACREAGFDQNVSETEREYTASDGDGIQLTLTYSGANMVDLTLFDPEQKWRSRGLGNSPAGGGEGEDGSDIPGEADRPDPDSFGRVDPNGTDPADGTDPINGSAYPNEADPPDGTIPSYGANDPDGTENSSGENSGNPDNINPDIINPDNINPDNIDPDNTNPDNTGPDTTDPAPYYDPGDHPDAEENDPAGSMENDSLQDFMQDSPNEYSEFILDDSGSGAADPADSGSEASDPADSINGSGSSKSGQETFHDSLEAKTDGSKTAVQKSEYTKAEAAAKKSGESAEAAEGSETRSGGHVPRLPAEEEILTAKNTGIQSRENKVRAVRPGTAFPLPAGNTGNAYILSDPAARRLDAALRDRLNDPLLSGFGGTVRTEQNRNGAQGTDRLEISGRDSRNAGSTKSGMHFPGEETRTAAALAGILAAASVLAGAIVKWRLFINSLD